MGRKRKDTEKHQSKMEKKIRRKLLAEHYLITFDAMTHAIYEGILNKAMELNEDFDRKAEIYKEAHRYLAKKWEDMDVDTFDKYMESVFEATDEISYKFSDKLTKKEILAHEKRGVLKPLDILMEDADKGFDTIREKIKDIRLEMDEKDAEYVINMMTIRIEDKYNEFKDEFINGYYYKNDSALNYMQSKSYFLDYSVNLVLGKIEEEKLLLEEIVELDLEDEDFEEDENRYKRRVRCTYKDLQRFLEHNGYEVNRQNATTHMVMKNEEGTSIPLPNKTRTCPAGTMNNILKMSKLTRSDLVKFLEGVVEA